MDKPIMTPFMPMSKDDKVSTVPPMFYAKKELKAFDHIWAMTSWLYVMRPERDSSHLRLSTLVRFGKGAYGNIGMVNVKGPFTPGQVGLVRIECAYKRMVSNRPSRSR